MSYEFIKRPVLAPFFQATASAALTFYQTRTDPTTYDLTETASAGWTDWALSSIVPAGTKAVLLDVTIIDDTAASYIGFRKNGHTYSSETQVIRNQVVNVTTSMQVKVECDSDRKIEYTIVDTGGGSGITMVQAVVKGFYKTRAVPKGSA